MKGSWGQSSLSRDFLLLSAAVLFLLFLISTWLTYITYTQHVENISRELEKEAIRTERTLSTQMENANYLLTALGKQIVIDPDRNLTRMAEMLKSFDSKGYIYSIFSFDNPQQQLVVSSNKGILDQPVDIPDRDYVKKAIADPWKMIIGSPIEGRVSEHWVIPAAMGLTDYTGKFVGTLKISIDIHALTEHISQIVKRDGISFAILSKTLVPLVQVSDDKDFVNNNFPPQKFEHVDFSKNTGGLISQGNSFFGDGNYVYYRASEDYPYIVLIGYDKHYSDAAMRSMLWSRLLQMLVMAVFFVSLLWLIRARMIKPIVDMTAIAAGVAKGDLCASLPKGGPVEMEGLAEQLRRVSEYIEENKRIEDELRNKMFMFKEAKEQAELDKRSKAEFMAHVCQEMRTPLNNIIGAAQVMKDQLYGPIENRKYRQYALDIYTTGNLLLDATQDMLTQSKAETDYIELAEKPVDVADVINRALRFVAEKMQAEKLNVKVKLAEPLPMLIADEFRLQQIVMNLLLHVLARTPPEGTASLEAKVVNENKDRMLFAIVLSSFEPPPIMPAVVTALADRIMGTSYRPQSRTDAALNEPTDLSLELAKTLVAMHNGALDIRFENGGVVITLLFASNRIRFVEGQ